MLGDFGWRRPPASTRQNARLAPVFRRVRDGAGRRSVRAGQIDNLRNTNDGMLRITNMINRHLPGT